MMMNVAAAVDDLHRKIKDSRARLFAEGTKRAHEDKTISAREHGVIAARKWHEEARDWQALIDILTGPIVGMDSRDGRLVLLTARGAAELRGNEFVALPRVLDQAA